MEIKELLQAVGLDYDADVAAEELISNIHLLIIREMNLKGVSKKELSDKMGKSASYITQCLNSTRNLSLESVAKILFALDSKVKVTTPFLEAQQPSYEVILSKFDEQNEDELEPLLSIDFYEYDNEGSRRFDKYDNDNIFNPFEAKCA